MTEVIDTINGFLGTSLTMANITSGISALFTMIMGFVVLKKQNKVNTLKIEVDSKTAETTAKDTEITELKALAVRQEAMAVSQDKKINNLATMFYTAFSGSKLETGVKDILKTQCDDIKNTGIAELNNIKTTATNVISTMATDVKPILEVAKDTVIEQVKSSGKTMIEKLKEQLGN